jgi:hypothetical protein
MQKVIREYVPIQEKIDAIYNVMALSYAPETHIYVPTSLEIFTLIEEFRLYTGYEVDTDTSPAEVYDQLHQEKLEGALLSAARDIGEFEALLNRTVEKLESREQSFIGFLDTIKESSDEINEKLSEAITKAEGAKDALPFLDSVIKNLG